MKFLRTTTPVKVYAQPSLLSSSATTLESGQRVEYTKIKIREGKEWAQVVVKGENLWIVFDKNQLRTCPMVHLKDTSTTGIQIEFKNSDEPSLQGVFKGLPISESGKPQAPAEGMKSVIMKIHPSDEDKGTLLCALEYDPNKVSVTQNEIASGGEYRLENEGSLLTEVSNEKGQSLYILTESDFQNLEDVWMGRFAMAIGIAITVGIFLWLLSQGWLVISGIIFMVAIVVGFIIAFIIGLIVKAFLYPIRQIIRRM